MPTTVSEVASGSAFNIGEAITNMSNSALTGIADTVTALIPVITTVVLINFAIRWFKKTVK